MLKILESRLFGFGTPKSFITPFVNERVTNLTLSSRTKVQGFHKAAITVLDIDTDDERFMLSGANDGSLCVYDLQNSSGTMSYSIKIIDSISSKHKHAHKYSIETLQWYPFDTGVFTSSGFDSTLKIWDTNMMKPVETVNLHHKVVCHHMSPLPAHSYVIAVAMNYPSLVLVDSRTGLNCHELRGHNTGICSVRWSPSCDHLLATGGMDSKILLWDVRYPRGCLRGLDQYNIETLGRWKDIITSHNGNVTSLRFTNDGLYLVSFGSDHELRLWDVALCKNTLVNFGPRISHTSLINNQQTYMELCCDTNPPILFVPTVDRIAVFDIFTGNKIKTLLGHLSVVNCCKYRSTLNQMFSAGNDRNILFWSSDTELEEDAFIAFKKKINNMNDEDAWSSDEDVS